MEHGWIGSMSMPIIDVLIGISIDGLRQDKTCFGHSLTTSLIV